MVLGAAACFGLISSPLAVLAIPCAYLIGLTVASIALILTATASTIGAMKNFFTVFITGLCTFEMCVPGSHADYHVAQQRLFQYQSTATTLKNSS